jgi:hypothetical protein
LGESGKLFGLPDMAKVAENGDAPSSLFLAGEIFVGATNGIVEVAQFVKDDCLLLISTNQDILLVQDANRPSKRMLATRSIRWRLHPR